MGSRPATTLGIAPQDSRPRYPTTYRIDADLTDSLRGQPRGSRIAPRTTVVAGVTAGRLALVDLGGGRRITLDAFGSRVWTLLTDHPTLPILLERLRRDGGRPEQIAEDTTRLLAHWRQRGLLAWR